MYSTVIIMMIMMVLSLNITILSALTCTCIYLCIQGEGKGFGVGVCRLCMDSDSTDSYICLQIVSWIRIVVVSSDLMSLSLAVFWCNHEMSSGCVICVLFLSL